MGGNKRFFLKHTMLNALDDGLDDLGQNIRIIIEVVADNNHIDPCSKRQTDRFVQAVSVRYGLHLQVVGQDNPVEV